MTLKGQGRDPIVFDAHYLEKDWRYTLGDNGAPSDNGAFIGNGPLKLHLTTSELWFGQEQEGILP